jgi:predicted  nucleic acid-binding Zn-ribbon protein
MKNKIHDNERHDVFLKRMMQETSKKSRYVTSDIAALKEDMKQLTEAYYEAIKRIKTLNDEVRHLKKYLTATLRKKITNKDKDEHKDEQKYYGEAPSTIASFYKK